MKFNLNHINKIIYFYNENLKFNNVFKNQFIVLLKIFNVFFKLLFIINVNEMNFKIFKKIIEIKKCN